MFVQHRAEEAEGRLHSSLQLLTGSGGAVLSSALCDSDRARGNGMELRQGRGSWGERKGLHQRAVGMEQPAQGSGHGPECRSSGGVWTALSDTGLDFR